jgi:hypothetical protein
MSQTSLTMEILSGPLDGHTILLTGETQWTQAEGSPLSFPWDSELGAPQARLLQKAKAWWLEASEATEHGTYCANRVGRIEGKMQLETGDVLKASESWLYVSQLGQTQVS